MVYAEKRKMSLHLNCISANFLCFIVCDFPPALARAGHIFFSISIFTATQPWVALAQ